MHARKSHKKSRLGCAACKRKHLKCDEIRPECANCHDYKLECEYPPPTTLSQEQNYKHISSTLLHAREDSLDEIKSGRKKPTCSAPTPANAECDRSGSCNCLNKSFNCLCTPLDDRRYQPAMRLSEQLLLHDVQIMPSSASELDRNVNGARILVTAMSEDHKSLKDTELYLPPLLDYRDDGTRYAYNGLTVSHRCHCNKLIKSSSCNCQDTRSTVDSISAKLGQGVDKEPITAHQNVTRLHTTCHSHENGILPSLDSSNSLDDALTSPPRFNSRKSCPDTCVCKVKSTMPATVKSGCQSGYKLKWQDTSLCQQREVPRSLEFHFQSVMADQRNLISHWTNFLHLAMSPVARIDMPGCNIFVPIAIAGISAKFEERSGETAVFHSICAASAFSLYMLRGNDVHFHDLAVRHRHLALNNLRHSMKSNNPIKHEAVWAAVTTLIILESIRGRAQDWRIHLKGLSTLILGNPHLIHRSLVARGIYESYLCVMILGNIRTHVDLKALLNEVQELEIIEPIHGISHIILDIIYDINSLSSSKVAFSKESLDRIELSLYAQSPSNIKTDGLDGSSAKLLVYYAHIYHYATIIHLRRMLLKAAPETLQDIVESAISYLEATEGIGGCSKGCIWTWPCLVISAECTTPALQNRMLAWYQSKERHGIANLSLACKISTEVWTQRLQDLERSNEIYWQDLIYRKKYDMNPL